MTTEKKVPELNFSLRTPWGILHFNGFRLNGISRPGYRNSLIHYDESGRLIFRTYRSFFGEPNHHALDGRCIGYSRRIHTFCTQHYDRRGQEKGHTHHFLGFVLIHHDQPAAVN